MLMHKRTYSALFLLLLCACGDDTEATGGGFPASGSSATAKIRVTPTGGLATGEAGSEDEFTVALTAAPSANVTIRISSSNESEGVVHVHELVFTPQNWDAQTVYVTGVDDGVADGNQSYEIVLDDAVSDDLRYQGARVSPVRAVNMDDDAPGVTVTHDSALHMDEAGFTTATIDVRLNTKPTGTVVIPVASLTPSEGTVSTHQLVFYPRNWDETQTVIVTGVDDLIDDGEQPCEVAFGLAESTDLDYLGLDVDDVTLTNDDDDDSSITVTQITGSINESEGETALAEFALNAQPTSDVTIYGVIEGGSGETFLTSALIFTPDDWNVAQRFYITPVDNETAEPEKTLRYLFTVMSDDPAYSDLTLEALDVWYYDDDYASIYTSQWSYYTCESTTQSGCCAQLDLGVTSQIDSALTLSLKVSDATEGSVSVSQVTVNPATGRVDTPVYVCGLDDTLKDGYVDFTVRVSVADTNDPLYRNLEPVELTYSNADDD